MLCHAVPPLHLSLASANIASKIAWAPLSGSKLPTTGCSANTAQLVALTQPDRSGPAIPSASLRSELAVPEPPAPSEEHFAGRGGSSVNGLADLALSLAWPPSGRV